MKIRLIPILLLFYMTAYTQSPVTLSPQAEIIIVTLGPGQQELYSAFGHSAIRVYDPINRLDRIYNYGVFDFDQPNFYLNFARGFLNYKLDTVDYPRFRYAYMYYDRFIHEQLLDFDSAQKQKFYEFLEWNMLPDNQYYWYDYFYDNCSTRVRDALVNVFGDDVRFDGGYIDTDYTIRELTDVYLKYQPWGDLGINIGLGLPMDKTATPWMYMYIPDYIESGFDNAYLKRNGEEVPLVKEKYSVYESRGTVPIETSIITPLKLFSALMVLMAVVSFIGYKKGKHKYWIDSVLFTVIGLLGLFLFLLWVATDHNAAARNMNLLWALPTHLVAGIALMKKNKPTWLMRYFLIVAGIGVVNLFAWPILPQLLHYALIPLVIILTLRAVKIWLALRLRNNITN